VKAAAYLYAAGDGPKPDELILADYIARFGVQAVIGRTLGAGEMRRIMACENIARAYARRQAAEDWVKWNSDNLGEAAILREAEGLVHG